MIVVTTRKQHRHFALCVECELIKCYFLYVITVAFAVSDYDGDHSRFQGVHCVRKTSAGISNFLDFFLPFFTFVFSASLSKLILLLGCIAV